MTPETPSAVLRLRQVTVAHGPVVAVKNLDLSLHARERLALIGPNGAGKSSLFQAISGHVRPSSGEIWLREQRIDGWAPPRVFRQGLARGFQGSQLFWRLSVRDNLRCALLWHLQQGHAFWKPLTGIAGVDQRVQELLVRLRLEQRAQVVVSALTHAEQRALELGMALAAEPQVVLLDEPTAGMSRSETHHFVELIRALTAACALLIVEHDMGVVFELADRVAVLVGGELLACASPAAVRADPRVQAAYLSWGGHAPGA